MSAQQFNQVLGRAVMDQAFRELLLTDPASALAGFELTPGEIDQLSQLNASQLALGGKGASTKIEKYFNPKEIEIDKPVPWQKHKHVDDDDEPTLEFTSGEAKPLDTELEFPAYDGASKGLGDDDRNFLFKFSEADSQDIASQYNAYGDGQGRKRRPLVLGGLAFLLLLLICVGLALAGLVNIPGLTPPFQGSGAPGADRPTATVDLTQVVGGIACGQVCPDSSSCAQGLVCAPNASGASVCDRGGHCGCGVPCDPTVTDTCDAGLGCTARSGQTVCWAGGCEAPATASQPTDVACQVIVGDGTCSACEDADSDAPDCAQSSSGGGDNQGGSCSCKCRTTCSGNTCRTVCKDCNGNSC